MESEKRRRWAIAPLISLALIFRPDIESAPRVVPC